MPPRRSHDARHSARRHAAPKLHRISGLALPSAAAAALMFTATGAAVATSPETRPGGSVQNAATVATAQPGVVAPALSPLLSMTAATNAARLTIEQAQTRIRHNHAVLLRNQSLARRNQAVARASAAARVSRSLVRKKLAARAVEAAKISAKGHGWQLPTTNPVKTSGFGYRWGRLHAGEDFALPTGTDLASMSTGKVDFAGTESGYGTLLKIRYWDGTVSYFAHMSSISVSVGEGVAAGQIVGKSGNSGHSTGPHLHLEIHPRGGEAIDPLPWLASHNIAP